MNYYDILEESLPFRTIEGAIPSIRVNILRELPKARQKAALRRLRAIVEAEPLDGYDDTTIGCKNTECTWGLCQQNKKLWPDPQDYKWPHDEDRVAPISRVVACPLDTDPDTGMGNNGCFYRCGFFNSRKFGKPTREEVLKRIDELLENLNGKA